MSKAKVQRKRPALTSRPAGVPAELADLLGQVETCCNRAAGIVNAAARAVAGDELTPQRRLRALRLRDRPSADCRGTGNARRSCLACPDADSARPFSARARHAVAASIRPGGATSLIFPVSSAGGFAAESSASLAIPEPIRRC